MRQPRAKVVITCAVTGNLTTARADPASADHARGDRRSALPPPRPVPPWPTSMSASPAPASPRWRIELYREVVERIRARNPRLILNLTTGPGGRFVPSEDDPKVAGPGTTLLPPERRVEHIAALRPDICTLDLNTMNSGGEVVINTPGNVRRMAKVIAAAGVRPEIELFDSGDIALLHDLLADGTLASPPLCSFVMGVRYGFQPSPETVLYARGLLPADAAVHGHRRRPRLVPDRGPVLPRRRPRARRPRGRRLPRARGAGALQRGAGREGPPHRRGPGRPDRHARRGPRDPGPAA